jgi:hypothetical protein
VYDPNWPDRDDVTLSLGIADPARPASVTMSPSADRPVIAFFRVGYRTAVPP